MGDELMRLARELGFRLPAPRYFAELRAVGCDERRALIARVVVALGIDQDRSAGLSAESNHAADVCEPAFAVIRQYDGLRARQRALEIAQLRGKRFMAGRGFEVDAHELLLPAYHPQLDGGLQRTVDLQLHAHPIAFQQPTQNRARFVAAYHRQQVDPATERCDVTRDICRAAGAFLHAIDFDDRNRRLRRDARDLAEPVSVEHDVTHYQNVGLTGGAVSPRPRHAAQRTLRGSLRCVDRFTSVATSAFHIEFRPAAMSRLMLSNTRDGSAARVMGLPITR
jgi:hypothetical protein